VLVEIEGHLLVGYRDGGDNPDKQLELVPGAVRDASKFLAAHSRTQARFERVGQLVEGYESPFGLELLSTVHWVATREGARTPEDVTRKTYAWSDRKRQFSDEQIRLALARLNSQNWIAAS
jgi:hypothetical protein